MIRYGRANTQLTSICLAECKQVRVDEFNGSETVALALFRSDYHTLGFEHVNGMCFALTIMAYTIFAKKLRNDMKV